MKTKIIGITLAAIMIALLFSALVPTGSAQSLPATSYNGLTNNISLIANTTDSTAVLIGQNVLFTNAIGVVTIQGDPASDTIAGELFNSDASGQFDTGAMTKAGVYYVNATTSGTTVTKWFAKLAVTQPTMTLKLRSGGTDVSSITEGTALQTILTNNLDSSDMVSLVIVDPDGNTITGTTTPVVQYFNRVNVSTIAGYGTNGINTTGWKLGAYTVQVQTDKNATLGARGLTKSTSVETLTILKSTIAIEASTTDATELEVVKLTVTGVNGHSVTVATSDSARTTFPGGSNNNPPSVTYSWFNDTIDADGKRTYSVSFNDTGSYTITVTDNTASGTPTDTVDISVSEKGVVFDVPSILTIGDKFTLKGTANTGSTVDIAVEGFVPSILNDLVIDENNEFSKEVDTATAGIAGFGIPGSVRIKAYIDSTGTGFGADRTVATTEIDDGSTALLMVRGSLVAELSRSSAAQEDDFTVSGTAPGSSAVNVLIVSPKGTGGTTIDGATTGIYHTTSSVSDVENDFSKKITVGASVDTGYYLVAVLTPGSDAVYNGLTGSIGTSGFYTALSTTYTITSKTQDQIIAIIQDATVDAAGSDDLIWIGSVKVETPVVELDPIQSVGVGEPLVITGTSNRKEGFAIVITVKGPTELTPQTVYLKDGTLNATFDTTGELEGTYIVKADDGDGHTDEATVTIGAAVPTVAPTTTPEATPETTPEATAPATVTPTTEEPTETEEPTPTDDVPGFESVFAIAGLLAVAYLVLRIKK